MYRYFILTNNTLNYYLSDKDIRKPKGNVLIVSDGKVRAENAIATKNAGKDGKKFFGFRLTTPFESILFLAVTEADRALWVRAIQDAIDRAHQSLRGYMLKRLRQMGIDRTIRKFWVLHKNTITYHKDHENTKIDEFEYEIKENTEIEPDDQKWKIKINDSEGNRVVTIQFEERTSHEYPLWRDALLDIRDRHIREEKEYQEHVTDVLTNAVESGEMNVLGEDGNFHQAKVAFTEKEVVIQEMGDDGEEHAAFFELSSSSTIKRLEGEEANGSEFAFQLTTATETIQLTAKSEEEINEWVEAINRIVPQPIATDSDSVLNRAAIKKFEEGDVYEVVIEEKKALGMVFQPVLDWALIKAYDGYDDKTTGATPGSALMYINDVDMMYSSFTDTTTMLKDCFHQPEPLHLHFRRAPTKSGYMNKKSANKKNGKAKWINRGFELNAGKLYIYPIEGEGEHPIILPIKDAKVSLVPYSEYLRENCFSISIGPVSMVLQAESLEEMLDWAATLKYAVAIASGGGYILEHLQKQYDDQQAFEATLANFNEEMSEEAQSCIVEIGTAINDKDSAALEVALTNAYNFEECTANAEFLELAGEQLNMIFESQHGAETDMESLALTCQPDAEQLRIMEENAALAEMEAAMDCMAGDSDDEGVDSSARAKSMRQSAFVNSDDTGGLDQETIDRLAAEESAAEYKAMKALEALEEPDPEEIGVCATEEDLVSVFGFYKKKNEEGGEDYLNVMNFCTIWRMVTGNKGNLMEEMQIFQSFDQDKNSFLEVDDFVTGFLNHSLENNTNKLLIKLHSLVDGGNAMI
jgi:hypothetical protein